MDSTRVDVEKHGDFLKNVVQMIFKSIYGINRQSKVIEWLEPEELKEILDLNIEVNGESNEKLMKLVEDTLRYSVKTAHPYFMSQLFSGLDAYGLAGQWVTDALNPSVYTYEITPVFTLMEQAVFKEMCKLVGYPEGSDGMFCPGGSLSNGTALNLARYDKFPGIKINGMWNLPKLVVFASEEAHYSIQKMSSLLGIGEANVIEIKTDEFGRMIPEDLEKQIQEQKSKGHIPCAVVVTLGTTVRGAFDPVDIVADICKKHQIWVHADGAWGGTLIFSKKNRYLIKGLEKTDSVTINPHKLLSVPQQCSLLLVKKGSIIKQCHSREATYLFQKDKFYDTSYDCGDKYFQCARRCDVFKFWIMWKAKGSQGFEKHVDDVIESSKYLLKRIKEREDFELVCEPMFVNVCFWYIPPCLKKYAGQNGEYSRRLHMIAPRIKETMVKEGKMMINYQPLKNYPNFFRFVSQNPSFNEDDIDYMLNYLAECGKKIIV